MSSGPSELQGEVVVRSETYRYTWLGREEVVASRVRAPAFPEPGKLLLVLGDDGYQIPGGGIETGESVSAAVSRELMEEAGATIVRSRRLGVFRIEGVTNDHADLHDFYWAHVTLANDWSPPPDISARIVVRADEFLDTLPWGRSDPRAEFLLRQALEIDSVAWIAKGLASLRPPTLPNRAPDIGDASRARGAHRIAPRSGRDNKG